MKRKPTEDWDWEDKRTVKVEGFTATASSAIEELEGFWDHMYKTCESCKGTGDAPIASHVRGYLSKWVECPKCKGTGRVLK